MAEPDKLPPPVASEEIAHPIIAHLLELRDRVLRVVLTVLAIFMGLFAFRNDLYTFLAEPLMSHLPKGSTMIATEVASPFLTPVKLALMVAILLAVPVILYHLWAFVAPGLYKNERKMVYPLLISSTLLFFAGTAFAYFVVFPLAFGFFTSVAPEGVAVMTDINKYLDFVFSMFFAFGVAFEVPIAVILLVWTGVVTPESLVEKRRYVIVGAFVVGMLLTPPDVFSQVLLAVPMWLLFEVGVVVSRLYVREKDEPEGEEIDEAVVEKPSVSERVFTTPAGTQPALNVPYSIAAAPKPAAPPKEPG